MNVFQRAGPIGEIETPGVIGFTINGAPLLRVVNLGGDRGPQLDLEDLVPAEIAATKYHLWLTKTKTIFKTRLYKRYCIVIPRNAYMDEIPALHAF